MGPTPGRRRCNVTIPLLTPTIFFNTVLGIIGALQTFAAAFVATEGGPGFATWFFSLHIWKHAFDYWNMGYAASLAWFFAIIIVALTILQMQPVQTLGLLLRRVDRNGNHKRHGTAAGTAPV